MNFGTWLRNRALHLSHRTALSIAKRTGVPIAVIEKLNDAFATIGAAQLAGKIGKPVQKDPPQ